MKQVIYVPNVPEPPPVEFTHIIDCGGWEPISQYQKPTAWEGNIVYLGNDTHDGDMFAVYHIGYIFIFKGFLNSGKY